MNLSPMTARLCLVALLSLGATAEAAQNGPNLEAVKGAIVIVIAQGVVPSMGNAPAAVQGTGFFVSKDGYLVTAYHLRSDLGNVDEGTITYELRFGPSAADSVEAAPVFINPAVDIMVLHANVGDRPLQVLKPADVSGVVLGVTPIYTAGYPQGYQYTVDQGFIKNFGMIGPQPLWATSMAFKVGQSGSPILLADNRVIAIAKATDQDATTIGLVVPIVHNVPLEYWDGSLRVTAPAAAALRTGDTKPFDRVVVKALVAPAKAERQTAFELRNEHCAGSATKDYQVTATPGWTIDPESIKVDTLGFDGAGVQVVLADKRPDGFTVAAQLNNIGRCVDILGKRLETDIAAAFRGRVSYQEIPNPDLLQEVTISNATVIGNVKIPLPNTALNRLSFSVVSAAGQEVPFAPALNELAQKAGSQVLDAAKAVARVDAAAPPPN